MAFCGHFDDDALWSGVAGLRIITLPASSTKDSSPKPFPKLIRNSVTFSMCPDGRGKTLFFYERVKGFVLNIWEGVMSLKGVRNIPLFSFYTLAIWGCYFFHFYFTFYCFAFTHIRPTKLLKRFESRAQSEQIFRHLFHLLHKASSSK